MENALNLLEQAPLIAWLRTNMLGYVFLNAAHVLSLGMFIGAVMSLDLGILKVPSFGWSVTVAQDLRRMAIVTFAFTVSTGLLLFSVRPADYLGNDVFIAKIFIIFAAAANALLFQHLKSAIFHRTMAGLSIFMWIGVLIAGRLIGFV